MKLSAKNKIRSIKRPLTVHTQTIDTVKIVHSMADNVPPPVLILQVSEAHPLPHLLRRCRAIQ